MLPLVSVLPLSVPSTLLHLFSLCGVSSVPSRPSPFNPSPWCGGALGLGGVWWGFLVVRWALGLGGWWSGGVGVLWLVRLGLVRLVVVVLGSGCWWSVGVAVVVASGRVGFLLWGLVVWGCGLGGVGCLGASRPVPRSRPPVRFSRSRPVPRPAPPVLSHYRPRPRSRPVPRPRSCRCGGRGLGEGGAWLGPVPRGVGVSNTPGVLPGLVVVGLGSPLAALGSLGLPRVWGTDWWQVRFRPRVWVARLAWL